MLHTSFLADLEQAGFPRESIDYVLCTHLHVDHVGWNTMLVDDRWIPTFPHARYLIGRKEWEHWSVDQSKFVKDPIDDSVRPVIDADLAEFVEPDHKLTDEVWLESTPGHTPGHFSVRISSGGHDAVITGDLMHHPIQFLHPEWNCGADSIPEMARATRRAFIERYADPRCAGLWNPFRDAVGGPYRQAWRRLAPARRTDELDNFAVAQAGDALRVVAEQFASKRRPYARRGRAHEYSARRLAPAVLIGDPATIRPSNDGWSALRIISRAKSCGLRVTSSTRAIGAHGTLAASSRSSQ